MNSRQTELEDGRARDWVVRAVCECGKTFEAWRGNLFFVREQCCPKCGADKQTFAIETVRWIKPLRGPWWKLWPTIKPGFWQRAHPQPE